eukprot:3068089-Amphidinium_carterae.1
MFREARIVLGLSALDAVRSSRKGRFTFGEKACACAQCCSQIKGISFEHRVAASLCRHLQISYIAQLSWIRVIVMARVLRAVSLPDWGLASEWNNRAEEM